VPNTQRLPERVTSASLLTRVQSPRYSPTTSPGTESVDRWATENDLSTGSGLLAALSRLNESDFHNVVGAMIREESRVRETDEILGTHWPRIRFLAPTKVLFSPTDEVLGTHWLCRPRMDESEASAGLNGEGFGVLGQGREFVEAMNGRAGLHPEAVLD
jgi:hypothetical protein